MTHTHGIGNFSGVLLKIGKKCMTEIYNYLMDANKYCLGWHLQTFKHYYSE
jgi:hypothetical protein